MILVELDVTTSSGHGDDRFITSWMAPIKRKTVSDVFGLRKLRGKIVRQ